MKRFLLSLLACWMYVSAFAQPEVPKKNIADSSDKWVITKVKGSTGKLFVSLPKGTEWDMTIYPSGSKKVLSNTSLKQTVNLLPGSYDLQINHIWIKGVPVEKGSNTRLKTGVLHITHHGSWTLYDETQHTVLVNSYNEQKRGLPVGKYKLDLSTEAAFDIEIKDGKMVEDSTPMETKVSSIPQLESLKWETTPLESIPDGMGRLEVKLPGAQTVTLPGSGESFVMPDVTQCIVVIGGPTSMPNEFIKLPKDLAPGTYTIRLNKAFVHNVPIQEGKLTRLKAGFLTITLDSYDGAYWKLFGDHNGEHYLLFDWEYKGGTYALPPGKYSLRKSNPYAHYEVTIIDGESVTNGVKQ